MTTSGNLTIEGIQEAISDEELQRGSDVQDTPEFDPLDNDSVNKAADVFANSIPRIKALARNMKGGALYRVFAATMEFPLQDKEPKFLSKTENELFILCLSSVMAKTTMLQAMAVEQARLRKLEEQTIAPVTEDVLAPKAEEA